jgi:hypothetical protein
MGKLIKISLIANLKKGEKNAATKKCSPKEKKPGNHDIG